MLGPIQSHPYDPFQIVTSGLNEIFVLDSRYGRAPLLKWNHGLSDAPPEMLNISPIQQRETMICATSLSIRTSKKIKHKCVSVRSQTSSSNARRVIFGDRSIVVTRYKSGTTTEIPSPFVGQGREVTQSPISLGIPVHVPTSEDTSHLWPREPVVGLIVRGVRAYDIPQILRVSQYRYHYTLKIIRTLFV